MTIERFPRLGHQEEDNNPAIQMFGRRFYADQTSIEYLAELLLLFISRKRVGDGNWNWERSFPDIDVLKSWHDNETLKYAPPARLSLKLFAFLATSRLETRHACHRDHFEIIAEELLNRIETSSSLTKDQVLTLLEQVLTGFTGIAKSRTWCTHTFLPICPELIARETIWKHKDAFKKPKLTWHGAIDSGLFVVSNHDFMARGGEVLFLQLCNLFQKLDSQEAALFEQEIGYSAGSRLQLRSRIENGINKLFETTSSIDKLAEWISSADRQTQQELDKDVFKPMTCGWCPSESWKEGYLFACEIANLCDAGIDPLEKVKMLKLGCVLQVLRSICAQSARKWTGLSEESSNLGGANGFAWIVTDPQSGDSVLKDAASRNLVRIQEMVHGAIRHPDIQLFGDYGNDPRKYKDADAQAHLLLVKLAKSMDFIIPYKGPNPRFAMTDQVLRFLVLALVPPGQRMTLNSFQNQLYLHYGIAMSGPLLNRAVQWTFPDQRFTLHSVEQSWVEDKLRATGFLIPLSDAVSLVQNPFGQGRDLRTRKVER
ncbi:hypothetical protein [Desulforhabdus sp. TSK]|uniref:hypothetical protein n=1 Tax=Desulforhabdus sp. TSK TaxID=2925014 RepID=UPI001FC86099|nr:hypothetical protein [Desulforhabdus sp. TSK]GKT09166.1 hypothetical protein DSTSK_24710 [Desulforhabdus sp. TSK]